MYIGSISFELFLFMKILRVHEFQTEITLQGFQDWYKNTHALSNMHSCATQQSYLLESKQLAANEFPNECFLSS